MLCLSIVNVSCPASGSPLTYLAMTYPRSHLVDPEGGVYHVTTRCVRQAFLCGLDRLTGKDFNHRQQWVEDRILLLAEKCPVDIYGYSIMSNHYHIVLNIEANRVAQWSDAEVADRWILLNAREVDRTNHLEEDAYKKAAILASPARIKAIRKNLGSLSWFMRFLNEWISRKSNKDDDRKGHFWESRFKSQRLLDEGAILACMVYVDLNPVRADKTDDITQAEHTSLKKRTEEQGQDEPLQPMNRSGEPLPFRYSLKEYTQLVMWTVKAQQSIRPTRPLKNPGLRKITGDKFWLSHYLPKPGTWQRAMGSVQLLANYAKHQGQYWIKTY